MCFFLSGSCKRKGIGLKKENLIITIVRTKENLGRVHIMGVLNAAGVQFKPFVFFRGKKPHFRKTKTGVIQTVHTFLLECYIYYTEKAGVDTAIFKDWVENFLDKTAVFRASGRELLLLYDVYGYHIRLSVVI